MTTSPTKNAFKDEGAKDFQEDPFENYRYEDLFLIDDPFKDDNGNEGNAINFFLLKYSNF